jgi:hypothetical protein
MGYVTEFATRVPWTDASAENVGLLMTPMNALEASTAGGAVDVGGDVGLTATKGDGEATSAAGEGVGVGEATGDPQPATSRATTAAPAVAVRIEDRRNGDIGATPCERRPVWCACDRDAASEPPLHAR